jgi:hypothetical protein
LTIWTERKRSGCRFAELVLFALAPAFDAAGGRGRRFSFDGLEALDLFARQVEPMAFFNQSEMGVGVGADKADGQPRLASAAGAADAADAMRVILFRRAAISVACSWVRRSDRKVT